MSLIIHDTISLTTASGVSRIQLCIGDITKLSKEEEVDVLVVSAFPGEVSVVNIAKTEVNSANLLRYASCNILKHDKFDVVHMQQGLHFIKDWPRF